MVPRNPNHSMIVLLQASSWRSTVLKFIQTDGLKRSFSSKRQLPLVYKCYFDQMRRNLDKYSTCLHVSVTLSLDKWLQQLLGASVCGKRQYTQTARNLALLAEAALALQLKGPFGPSGLEDSHIKDLPLLAQILSLKGRLSWIHTLRKLQWFLQ